MSTFPTPSKPKEARLFRNNGSQAVQIPVEFELPGERVLIHQEGNNLIIEPVTGAASIAELLAEWRKETALGPEGEFPVIDDTPARSAEVFYGRAYQSLMLTLISG